MPTTRSSTFSAPEGATEKTTNGNKRKANTSALKAPAKRSKKATGPEPNLQKNQPEDEPTVATQVQISLRSSTWEPPVLVPAELMFSFDDARRHLIQADDRFEELFNRMQCKPYQQLESLHPFRALVTSILGQQISWLAARSVVYRFTRLYDPSMPEKPDDYNEYKAPTSFFPSPQQVCSTDIPTLRSAGLSGRKAEYVRDLANRFADGRLSTEKLIQANDEELAEMLIEVKGIGRWTVDMFAIFSLRRPDILPVGDLGVQRGVLRWFLALHHPTYNFALSPEKIDANSDDKAEGKSNKEKKGAKKAISPDSEDEDADDELPSVAADSSAVPPAASSNDIKQEEVSAFPPTFTPSIREALHKPPKDQAPPPLPAGLTAAILKSRLDGKKKIKGALLTPQEMEDLTESWKPYRSLGVYYMWSLAEAKV
ncbi:DNA glycosylase [Pluteus cervinus]|uniref:DNA glycosylase n=1 Tax=Pluteus cervinus TaxID=181527 RepID=A0ACD3BC84_9AGAR|nr:DNA glycosylase [Pluteus cervinus]